MNFLRAALKKVYFTAENRLKGSLENTVYTENVELEFYLENSACEDFLLKLKETFAARITAEEITEKMLGVAE